MKINLTARHKSISANTKEYAREKAEKLEKFYALRKISIVMEAEGDNYSVEIVVSPERGGNTVVGNSKASEWLAAIDQANDKVERQLRKVKEKVKSHRMKKTMPEKKEQPKEEREETYDDVVGKMKE